jgi:hypothetical protein
VSDGQIVPLWRKRAARALVNECPAPYDRTLDAMCTLGITTGRVWAGLDKVAAKAKVSAATVVRHRSWLAERGYLVKRGGGYRGRNATYDIPALSTAPGKVLNGAQDEHLSTLERYADCVPEPLVAADVSHAATTTHAYTGASVRKPASSPQPPAGKSHFLPGTGWV